MKSNEYKKICVIGLGYIGLPTASLLATKGFSVLGVDVSQKVVDTINQGEIHIVEPDLDILVKSAVHSGNLSASLEPCEADVFIIAVPTPFKDGGSDHISGKKPDLSYIEAATKKISPYIKPGNLVILESTSPVGTTNEVVASILQQAGHAVGDNVYVSHCPERVLPGRILIELVENDRVVGGINDASTKVDVNAIAIELDAEEALCERAALLSKCDLITNMVGEFADLQGLMGAYYARNDGEPIEVCEALHEQYLPRFAGDKLPESTTGAILAIADKLDTMVGLFGIGQPPTGSKDPFALRRSAIGILRILVERELDLNIMKAISASISAHGDTDFQVDTDELVFDFLLERFRAWYQESGISSGVFQSVFVIKPQRPLDFYHRIQAVNSFNKLSEAVALSAANKRVSNLLSKQERVSESGICNVDLLVEPSEKVLYEAIQDKILEVAPMFEEGNYTAGLQSLSTLKQAVDMFFDNVLVMHEDERIRANRLALLQELRALFLRTADISYLHSN
mgnify:CR=1 FL=1